MVKRFLPEKAKCNMIKRTDYGGDKGVTQAVEKDFAVLVLCTTSAIEEIGTGHEK